MRPYLILPLGALLLASSFALAASGLEGIATLQKRLNSSGARTVAGESQVGATPFGTSKALDKAPTAAPGEARHRSTAGGVEEARSLVETAAAREKAVATQS